MSHLDYTLTSSDEHDLFNINRDQKNVLNQLIHFASKNFDERQKWYEIRCSMLQKELQTLFVNTPWNNLKLPNSSFHYVNKICDDIKCNIKENMSSLDVQKNNW